LYAASEQEFAHLADRIEEEFGRLDGLLHAAAELQVLGPIADLTATEVERSWRVNCAAPLQLTRALLPLLSRTGDAAIVFVSDSDARRAKAYWGAYGISKLAVEGLARILGEELHGLGRIRVNTLIPGPFSSPLYLKAYPGTDRSSLPPADSLADCLLYLLGPDSRNVKGQVLDSTTILTCRTQEGEMYVRP
jgi:NAD(P)-dependent dehydrogenase (short-subunit alcohol dehydrogenase family)